ncbi:MAG: hypothetical protein KA368_09215 [Acidobacteria bacterium]|nr:hypothetical protein [Acidobacteriota bacterium]
MAELLIFAPALGTGLAHPTAKPEALSASAAAIRQPQPQRTDRSPVDWNTAGQRMSDNLAAKGIYTSQAVS